MKKRIKIIIVFIIVIILIIGFSLVAKKIDEDRAKEGEKPLFCIKSSHEISDGGTTEYYGLGYKVIAFSTLSGYQEIKFGSWNMKYEDFKHEIEKQDAIAYYKEQIENLPRNLTVEEAVNRNFFVYDGTEGHHDEVYHKEVLERFVQNTQMDAKERKADEITIVIYNHQGIPTIYHLGYGFTEELGYILISDSTRIGNHIITDLEKYQELIIEEFPKEYYGITVVEEEGINVGIISLTAYHGGEEYKTFEIARYDAHLW